MLKDTVAKHYNSVVTVFDFYANMGSTNPFQVTNASRRRTLSRPVRRGRSERICGFRAADDP